MATIIGAFLQIYNKNTGQWDTHYFTTHANAIIQTTEKQFISEGLKNFIKNIKGDISGNYIDYDELTDTVLSNTNEITGVKSRVSSIEALINLDEDNIISNLQEILDFISEAEITEGKTITEFVDDITKLKVNDTNPIGATNEISIYAPTNKGTVDQILVSTGTSTPQFKTIKNVVVKETTPSASDYGKTAFQGGEIWLDTSGVIPGAPITIYNLKLVYDTTFNNQTDLFAFYHFTNKPENAPLFADGFAPLLYFETNEGLMAFGISKSGASGEVTLSPCLQKWNNSTNKYDLPYGDSMFQCIYIVDAGGDISNHYFYGGRDLIVPGGRLILSVEDKYTQLDINKPYTLTVVPS